jgi:peptide/nickel transport system permease protein
VIASPVPEPPVTRPSPGAERAAPARRIRVSPVAALRRQPAVALGAALLALHVGLALLGPTLAPHGFAEMQMLHTLEAPSRAFLAGTDQFGRDNLSRVMWGARRTLAVAAVSTLLGVALGVAVGMIGGYYRGWIDEVLMRLVDGMMAIPALLLAMLILTTLGSSSTYVVLGIAVVFMPRTARMVRGVALSLGAAEFVDAARLRGESGAYVIFREMLPNAWAPIIVETSIRFSYAILLATSLGFLGLGAGPPTPDWGLMINEALPFLDQAPWLAVLPAAAIASAVVGANLIGEGIREALALRQSLDSA